MGLFKRKLNKNDLARLQEYEDGKILQVDKDIDSKEYLINLNGETNQ